MFTPKTKRIEGLVRKFPYVATDLNPFFGLAAANAYVDYGNVRNWASRLGWHVDLKRLKQLLDSFSGETVCKFYYGTRDGVQESEQLIRDADSFGYEVHTKSVKTIRLSVDVSSISADSPDIIKSLICPPFLKTLKLGNDPTFE